MTEDKKLAKAKERLEAAKVATAKELRMLKTAWFREPDWNGAADTTIRNLKKALTREAAARVKFGEEWSKVGYSKLELGEGDWDTEVLEVFGL